MSAAGTDTRSLPQLLSDLVHEMTTLLRRETQLVRAEISEKITKVEAGVGSILAGTICLLVALNVLAGALVIALANWIGAGWSALVVGLVLAVMGAILVKTGTSSMHDLAPDRSMRQVAEDAKLVREQAR